MTNSVPYALELCIVVSRPWRRYVKLLIRGRFQNLKGGEKPCHGNEGGVHGHHEEGLGCREVD